jgi:hypothetical protein
MKKLVALFAFFILFSLGLACETIDFDDGGDICIDINSEGSNDYKIRLVDDNSDDRNLRCGILLPNGKYKDLGDCNNEEFEYDSDDNQKIKIYARDGVDNY